MALSAPYPELDEFLSAIGAAGQRASEIAASEGAAGNISIAIGWPVEATALGNIVVQAIATGKLPDLAAGRKAVAASTDLAVYEPHNGDAWDVAIVGFDALIGATEASQ
jgi:hypothetical protein